MKELCPKPNDTRNTLSKKSHVEEFDGVPELFNALISSQTDQYDWKIFTFQIDFDAVLSSSKLDKDIKYYLNSNSRNLDEVINEKGNLVTINCTVIYLDQCTSWNKCRQTCRSTGANSYRWFHDGCCECVGSTCINYGINESRCNFCPDSKDLADDADESIDDDIQDFGDKIGPFDEYVNSSL